MKLWDLSGYSEKSNTQEAYLPKPSISGQIVSLELQISYGFRQLVNTELENRPWSHLTQHNTPARGKKRSSSRELA